MKNIDNKLTALEKELTPDPLRVLAMLPEGTERVLTVEEMQELDAAFCRVISGSDMRDLDKLLDWIRRGVQDEL